METDEESGDRHPPRWKHRLLQAGIGAAVGAVKGGPAGVLGGVLLGVWVEVCVWDLTDCLTTLWPWVRAFVLAGIGACSLVGAAQDGISGAVLGAVIGAVAGLIVGLTLGTGICVVGGLARRIRGRA
jgi:hypothetical protein